MNAQSEEEAVLRILCIGEVLWDVFGSTEILGGAALNFAVAAQRLGNSVRLLTAVGADRYGEQAMARMQDLGLPTDFVQTVPDAQTGTAVVTAYSEQNPTFVIQRLAAYDLIELDETLCRRIAEFRPDWIYFGTLAQALEVGERRLDRLLSAIPRTHCFYDINLREGHWNLPLVERLARRATIAKLNEAEAETLLCLVEESGAFSIERFCRSWSAKFGTEVICVTRGEQGCAVWRGRDLELFEGYPVAVVDTVGSGDAFAAAFLHGHDHQWSMEKTARFANALGAIVASRAGATPNWHPDECAHLMHAASGK